MNYSRLVVWSPICERVGTIETELLLLRSFQNIPCLHIGACSYFSRNHLYRHRLSTSLLSPSLIKATLALSPLLAGRITILMQSCIAAVRLLPRLISGRTLIFTTLFPLPLLLLKVFFPARIYLIALVQGAPTFTLSKSSLSGYSLFGRFFRNLETSLRRSLYSALYSKADHVVVSSYRLKTALQSLFDYKSVDIRIIPNGILSSSNLSQVRQSLASSHIQPDLRSKAASTKRQLSFVLIGRLTYQKNFDSFLSSLVSLSSTLPYEWTCRIYGSGDQYAHLVSKYSGCPSIEFCGYTPTPWSSIDRSSIVVVPSLWEEPGHVPLEALSRGIPCFTSTHCSCIDFFPKNISDHITFDLSDYKGFLLKIDQRTKIFDDPSFIDELMDSLNQFTCENFSKKIHEVIPSIKSKTQ